MLTPFRRSRRFTRWIAVAASFVVVPLLASPDPVQASSTQPLVVKKVFNLTSSGSVTLTRIHYQDPNEVRVLTINPGPNTTIDQHASTDVFSAYKKVSDMANGSGAIAAINGDFANHAYPTHWNEIDGVLRTSGPQHGVGFAISKDETLAWAKHPGSHHRGPLDDAPIGGGRRRGKLAQSSIRQPAGRGELPRGRDLAGERGESFQGVGHASQALARPEFPSQHLRWSSTVRSLSVVSRAGRPTRNSPRGRSARSRRRRARGSGGARSRAATFCRSVIRSR